MSTSPVGSFIRRRPTSNRRLLSFRRARPRGSACRSSHILNRLISFRSAIVDQLLVYLPGILLAYTAFLIAMMSPGYSIGPKNGSIFRIKSDAFAVP